MRGARAVLDGVVTPTTDTPIAIVWAHRVMLDNEVATANAAAGFGTDGGRIAHFFEKDAGLGHMVNASLGWPAAIGGDRGAWDIYLYYGPDARWTDAPPRPTRYFHQLGYVPDDPGLALGDELTKQLRATTNELLVGATTPARE